MMQSRGYRDHELDIINGAVLHLKQFVNRTKLYAQQITLMPELCAVKPLFQSTVAETVIPVDRDIILSVGRCDAQPLFCDQTHLREMLSNLIDNAVNAIPEGGRIELSYCCQRWKAVISVTDTGYGMEPGTLQKVFDPYFTTRQGSGNMGLGLYYCWNVMNAHHGSISVKSAPGRGSTVSLCFPMHRRNVHKGGVQ